MHGDIYTHTLYYPCICIWTFVHLHCSQGRVDDQTPLKRAVAVVGCVLLRSAFVAFRANSYMVVREFSRVVAGCAARGRGRGRGGGAAMGSAKKTRQKKRNRRPYGVSSVGSCWYFRRNRLKLQHLVGRYYLETKHLRGIKMFEIICCSGWRLTE